MSQSLVKDALGLILAGGRVDELAALTVHRPKSAMPFGGMYRIIDCALTNLARSGITKAGILSQYRPLSLMDHVRDGKYWDLSGYQKGVSFLPPHTGESDADWYKGTADALYQNALYIEHSGKSLSLVVSGDHIYRMDYSDLLQVHLKTSADLTIALTPVPQDVAHCFGLARVNSHGIVEEYREKPSKPISNLASMTVYLFNTDVLLSELRHNALCGRTFQIYDEIIPKLVEKGRVAACMHDGYWAYSRSIQAYYRANMDCLESGPRVDLNSWKLKTNFDIGRVGDHPPIRMGSEGIIQNALVSPGCIVNGTVINSVLSPLVTVDAGAEIRDSVVFEGVTVGGESIVNRAIIDKFVSLGNRVTLGRSRDCPETAVPNQEKPGLLDCGITVVGKRVHLADNMSIGANVIIYPDARPKELYGLRIQDGATIFSED